MTFVVVEGETINGVMRVDRLELLPEAEAIEESRSIGGVGISPVPVVLLRLPAALPPRDGSDTAEGVLLLSTDASDVSADDGGEAEGGVGAGITGVGVGVGSEVGIGRVEVGSGSMVPGSNATLSSFDSDGRADISGN